MKNYISKAVRMASRYIPSGVAGLAFAAITLGMGAVCSSCEDDNGSNPIVQQPESFVLNTPAYGSAIVDLLHSQSLALSTSQPDYGYTAAVIYRVQVSLTDTWECSLAQASADEDGNLVADYATVDESYTKVNIAATSELIDQAIEELAGWTSPEEIPATQQIYLRLQATLANYSTSKESLPCYSNSVPLLVEPYFVELAGADPVLWYLIGNCVGDGGWTNQESAIGTSIYPMSIVPDAEYDKEGHGDLTTIAYLTTAGFKLIQTPGSWDLQWGQGDSWGSFDYCNGGSANITPPEDGYYVISLNTASNTMAIEPYTEIVTEYPEMLISGSFNEWATDTQMTPVNTVEGVKNHVWTYTIVSDGTTEVKFLADAGWATNWGAAQFPYGYGEQNGANIVVPEGTWTVIFNDIDGSYEFIAQ